MTSWPKVRRSTDWAILASLPGDTLNATRSLHFLKVIPTVHIGLLLQVTPLNQVISLVFCLKNEKTLLDQRPKPYFYKFHQKPRILAKKKKTVDFDKNCGFWKKMWFWWKPRFLVKSADFVEKLRILVKKPRILVKTTDHKKSVVFTKIRGFHQNPRFSLKSAKPKTTCIER